METAQNFTKSLRDRSTALQARVDKASKLLDGQLDLYLPRKELVILEWLFSVLASETGSSQHSNIWLLLSRVWSESEESARNRVLQNHKFTPIVSDAFKSNGPLDEIALTVNEIAQTATLSISSDAQAGELLLNYFTRIQNLDVVGPQIEQLTRFIHNRVRSRSRIFQTYPQILPVLMSVPIPDEIRAFYLNEYFKLDFQSDILETAFRSTDEKHVTLVYRSVVSTDHKVEERFHLISKVFPTYVGAVLKETNGIKLGKSTLNEVLQAQLNTNVIDWSLINRVLELNPDAAATNIDLILKTLFVSKDHSDKAAILVTLLKVFGRLRRLSDLILKLASYLGSNESQAILFTTYENNSSQSTLLKQVTESLDSLSSVQLLELLKSLDDKQTLAFVLANLSYRAVSPHDIWTYLTDICETAEWIVKFNILNLITSSVVVSESWGAQLEKSLYCIGSLLRAKELDSNASIEPLMRSVLKNWTLSNEDAAQLVSRFFTTLNDISSDILESVVKHVTDFDSILSIMQLYEYPLVRESLFGRLIHLATSAPNYLDCISTLPASNVISRQHRGQMLELAWGHRNFQVLIKLLEYPPKSTKYEREPKYLIQILDSLTLEEVQFGIDLSKALLRDKQFKDDIAKLIKIKKWRHWCAGIFTFADGSQEESDLFARIEKQLKKGADIEAIVTIYHTILQNKSDLKLKAGKAAAELALSLPPDSPSAAVLFSILCSQRQNYVAIAAYFIYTGSKFLETFRTFCRQMDENEVQTLHTLATHGNHFTVLLVLAELVPKNAIYAQKFTELVTVIRGSLNELSEEQCQSFLGYVSSVITDHSWLVTQFALETILAAVHDICSPSFTVSISEPEAFYSSLTLIVSRILLFQRYRLQGRMHTVVSAFSSLLTCVAGTNSDIDQKRGLIPKWTSFASADMGKKFERLMQNLCNPPQNSVRASAGADGLTSSVARTRRQVAKSAGFLLSNYVFMSLQYGFNANVNHTIRQGIFELLNLMSASEVTAATADMDGPSRAFFRPLYDEYKTTGRWTKD